MNNNFIHNNHTKKRINMWNEKNNSISNKSKQGWLFHRKLVKKTKFVDNCRNYVTIESIMYGKYITETLHEVENHWLINVAKYLSINNK